MKKEFKKKDIPQSISNINPITKDDLFDAIEKSKDSREKVYSDMVNQLFDEKKLLMTSRLSETYIFYIIKHLIISRFFVSIWDNISVKKWIKKTDKYPYYEVKHINTNNNKKEDITQYRKFIDELLMLPVSKDGMGRNEILSIIKATEDKLREMDIAKAAKGTLNRILD